MSLIIPQDKLARIQMELATLEEVIGKVVLTIEFNCSTGGKVNTMKVKKYSEEEVR